MKKYEIIFNNIIDEYTLAHSTYMDKVIDFQKSISLFYKKWYNDNIYKHPKKYIEYLITKYYLNKLNYKKYIDIYLYSNQGWYKSDVIPEDKINTKVEIILTTGKRIFGKMSGYGFYDLKNNDCCNFGWQVWVNRWRFLPEQSNINIEKIM
jgi:hypothetical protein